MITCQGDTWMRQYLCRKSGDAALADVVMLEPKTYRVVDIT